MPVKQDRVWHFGRSFGGPGPMEDCPCGKAACGLVDEALIDPACTQHPVARCKTIRVSHWHEDCPA